MLGGVQIHAVQQGLLLMRLQAKQYSNVSKASCVNVVELVVQLHVGATDSRLRDVRQEDTI